MNPPYLIRYKSDQQVGIVFERLATDSFRSRELYGPLTRISRSFSVDVLDPEESVTLGGGRETRGLPFLVLNKLTGDCFLVLEPSTYANPMMECVALIKAPKGKASPGKFVRLHKDFASYVPSGFYVSVQQKSLLEKS